MVNLRNEPLDTICGNSNDVLIATINKTNHERADRYIGVFIPGKSIVLGNDVEEIKKIIEKQWAEWIKKAGLTFTLQSMKQ